MRGFSALAMLKTKATRFAKRQERLRIGHDQKEALRNLSALATEMGVERQKRWKRIVNFAVRVLGAATKPLRRRPPA